MKQGKVEEFSRRFEIRVPVEPPRQDAEPAVYWKGIDGKPPRRHVKDGSSCTNWDGSQAVTKGNSPAQVGANDRHHLVTSTSVVRSQAPAQSVEVSKLPRKQYCC